MKTVGEFTLLDSGALLGPKAYLESDEYRSTMGKVGRGEDPCGAFRFSPDPVTALLVTLQTSFAGWLGMQQLTASLER